MSVDHPSTRGNLHVSRREIHTRVKRPNRARTSIQPNINFIQKGNLFTSVFDYNLHKTGSLAKNFTKTEKIQYKANLAISSPLKPGCVPSPSTSSVPEKMVLRRGEQCPVVKFPYLGYSPPKCNAMAHQTFNTC